MMGGDEAMEQYEICIIIIIIVKWFYSLILNWAL